MKIVIVTDIFGLCKSTDNLKKNLASHRIESMVVDPYQGVRNNFLNERQAYSAFINQCGHDEYYSLVAEIVSVETPDFLIGFSAGASAIWRVSGLDNSTLKGMVCFYPTQIRHHLNVTPKIPVKIVFPSEEETFDVHSINQQLSTYRNVATEITQFRHGFMNTRSAGYALSGENHGTNIILECLKLNG